MNKTILEIKNSKKEYLYDVILSGESSFNFSAAKTISKRRIEKGVYMNDNATIEPATITISGSIADIPALVAGLQHLNKNDGIIKDDLFKGILAGSHESVKAIFEVNPKKFSSEYRAAFNNMISERDAIFNIYNPKDNSIVYKDYYLTKVDMNEKQDSTWGFDYNLSFVQILIWDKPKKRKSKPNASSAGKKENCPIDDDTSKTTVTSDGRKVVDKVVKQFGDTGGNY